jgi:hypothetical protein
VSNSRSIYPSLKKNKRSASYFEDPSGNKKRKEIHILGFFLESLDWYKDNINSCPQNSDIDPPDCFMIDHEGRKIGVEITEFTDQESIRNSTKGNHESYIWKENDVLNKINEIVKMKDKKEFKGGPYQLKWLIIHTDEGSMTYSDYKEILSSNTFYSCAQFHEVYFLFSPNPEVKTDSSRKLISTNCKMPFIRLKTKTG